MIGKIIAYLAFVLSLGATGLFLYSFISKKDELKSKLSNYGGYFYWLVTLSIAFMSAFLLSLILDHNFSYTYIHNYSSKELPTLLLISSFYAGQEGSFMLWALFFVLVGLFVRPYSKKYDYEAPVMTIYSLILTFLVLLIILKSPFERLWDTMKDNPNVTPGLMPENGRGMNPILQNYWMAIHPPILFIGYALMSVPYVFAIAALIKRDYFGWIRVSIPWTIVATAVLGLGIMLGGFWAYETLGWGGFWGWDPVENSSLLPWLIGVALLHTLIVQEKTGGLIKTNLILAILTFVLVIYATFLTRSGVLSDTSVHSFTEPGNLVYAVLIAFLAITLLLGFVFYLIRVKDIPYEKKSMSIASKEAFLTIGSMSILASAIIVFFGTSFPIFSAILGSKQGSPQIQFFNDSNLPIAIIILLTNALAVFLNWRSDSFKGAMKKSLIAIIISLVGTVISFFIGVKSISIILLVFASIYTLVINLEYTFKYLKRNPRHSGAFISHLGLAFFMFGVIGSGVFSQSKDMHLALGESSEFNGYKFTFVGNEQIEKELKDRLKFYYIVKIEKDGKSDVIKPLFYLSDFNERMEPFREPGVKTMLFKDIYISPSEVRSETVGPVLRLAKTESGKSPLDSNIKVEFSGFDMMHSQNQTGMKVQLGGIVKIDVNGNSYNDTLVTLVDMQTSEFTPVMKKIQNSDHYIGFAQFLQDKDNISNSRVMLVFSKDSKAPVSNKEVFTFEVSTKPLMNLVWLGVIFVIGGFIVSAFKRKGLAVKHDLSQNQSSESTVENSAEDTQDNK